MSVLSENSRRQNLIAKIVEALTALDDSDLNAYAKLLFEPHGTAWHFEQVTDETEISSMCSKILEKAIELAHVCGRDSETVHGLVDSVYSAETKP